MIAHAAQAEPGGLYAGLRVLCRLGRIEAVERVIASVLDSADDPEGMLPARRTAAAEALLLDCPRSWHERLVRTVQPRIGMLAPALARDGKRAAPLLLEMLADVDDTDKPEILTALGKAGGPEAGPAVAAHVRAESPAVAAAAATAALRLSHAETYRYLLLAASARPWLIVPLALGGGAGAVRVLLDLLAKGQVSDEALLGLGLLGDLSAARPVFECLGDAEHAPAAALALQLMTGAELFGAVFVPDVIDPDELFDDERERYEQTGELPQKPDGTPFGSMETRILVDPALWKDWLAQNKGRFDRELRYRYGEPCAPRALLRSLIAPRVPNRVRALICDELKVRYDCDFPFAVCMPVARQRRMLEKLAREWIPAEAGTFAPGVWHFAGRPLDSAAPA
jgi:hypothetical protein